MREGDRVRVISGEHEGKTGEVIGVIKMSQVQKVIPGREISMEGAKDLWAIKFDDRDEQTVLEENEIEVINE